MTGDGGQLKARVRALAAAEGFTLARFAGAEPMTEAREAALEALGEGRLAGMGWMTADWIERATDPAAFLPGAKSVLVVALPAHGDEQRPPEDGVSRGRVARYARGRDYHRLFEAKLRRLARRLREELGASVRTTVDYGPLLERPLAVRAGLGWQGRSTMLLSPGLGPWVLLGAAVTDLPLEPDAPLAKSCGSCTRCIVACPTGAIAPDGSVLDARRCISYHTIENRDAIPRELRPLFGDWVFGCDDCLDACPVGAASRDTHPDLAAKEASDAFPPLVELLTLDQQSFEARFRGRAIMRAKRDGLARNACVALGNVGGRDALSALRSGLHDESALVRGHAAWAVGRLVERGVAPAAEARGLLASRLAEEDSPEVREEIEAALRA